ncbi:unnamed protein product [Trichobilharzia szidati]|nr:unnamed protein product [Trichobilharzia szidati]
MNSDFENLRDGNASLICLKMHTHNTRDMLATDDQATVIHINQCFDNLLNTSAIECTPGLGSRDCQHQNTNSYAHSTLNSIDGQYLVDTSEILRPKKSSESNTHICRQNVSCVNRRTRRGHGVLKKVREFESILSPAQLRPNNFIDLSFTNLDYFITQKEWAKILIDHLKPNIKNILSITMQTRANGNTLAFVRVGSVKDARFAISRFHQKRIGFRRIRVSIMDPNRVYNNNSLRLDVISLLRSASGYSLPLCKFIERFEKRFHREISASDLKKMRDIIEIRESPGSIGDHSVTLNKRAMEINGLQMSNEPVVCRQHCFEGSEDYIRATARCLLPCINIHLNSFREQLMKLLHNHGDCMPLMSFPACYKSEFGDSAIVYSDDTRDKPEVDSDPAGPSNSRGSMENDNSSSFLKMSEGEKFVTSTQSDEVVLPNKYSVKMTSDQQYKSSSQQHHKKQGVPLEHLITCVSSVIIRTESNGERYIVYDPNYEIGNMRMLTLSHSVQIRRFTSELIKVLKSQSTKSCRLADYPTIYKRTYRKEFCITDYGVCYLTDMLSELSDNAVEVTGSGSDTVVSLPKPIQTSEERYRTTMFADEVVDLLSQRPRCRLPINKFIPSYHHHFSRQCRVSDYGFTKLADLLDAISHVIQIIEENKEKYISLLPEKHLQIFAERLVVLLEASLDRRIPINDLTDVYAKHHGYALCLEDFNVFSLKELLSKFPHLFYTEVDYSQEIQNTSKLSSEGKLTETIEGGEQQTEPNQDGDQVADTKVGNTAAIENFTPNYNAVEYVCLVDRTAIRHLARRVILILQQYQLGATSVLSFYERFRYQFRNEPVLDVIFEELESIVELRKDLPNPRGAMSCSSSDEAIPYDIINPPHYRHTQLQSDPFQNVCDDKRSTKIPLAILLNCFIALRPLIRLAGDLKELLSHSNGKILLVNLCTMYRKHFGVPLKAENYNYPSLVTLLKAMDFVVSIRGRGLQRTVCLCEDFIGRLSNRVAYNTKVKLKDPRNPLCSHENELETLKASLNHESIFIGKLPMSSPHILCLPLRPCRSSTLKSEMLCTSSQCSDKPVSPSPAELLHENNSVGAVCCNEVADSKELSYSGMLHPSSSPSFAYRLPYAHYSVTTSGQTGSFTVAPSLNSSQYGYYHFLPVPPNRIGHFLVARANFVGHVDPSSQTAIPFLPNGTSYAHNGKQHPPDCHSPPYSAFNPTTNGSQTHYPTFTPLPPNQTSSTNFVAPTSTPTISNIPYASSLLSSPQFYPFGVDMTYLAPLSQAFHHQANPQYTGLEFTNHQLAGTNPNVNSIYPAKQFGQTHVCPEKSSNILTTFSAPVKSISSSTSQQRLDELVERLAYGNELKSTNMVVAAQNAETANHSNVYHTTNMVDGTQFLSNCLTPSTSSNSYSQINPFTNNALQYSSIYNQNVPTSQPGVVKLPINNSCMFYDTNCSNIRVNLGGEGCYAGWNQRANSSCRYLTGECSKGQITGVVHPNGGVKCPIPVRPSSQASQLLSHSQHKYMQNLLPNKFTGETMMTSTSNSSGGFLHGKQSAITADPFLSESNQLHRASPTVHCFSQPVDCVQSHTNPLAQRNYFQNNDDTQRMKLSQQLSSHITGLASAFPLQ